MNMICQRCGAELKFIPAGISKTTNRPYGAFYSCTNRECGNTFNAKTAGEVKQAVTTYTDRQDQKEAKIEARIEKKDTMMESLNAKKGAAEIVAAMIRAGITTDWAIEFKRVAREIYFYKPEDEPPFDDPPFEGPSF